MADRWWLAVPVCLCFGIGGGEHSQVGNKVLDMLANVYVGGCCFRHSEKKTTKNRKKSKRKFNSMDDTECCLYNAPRRVNSPLLPLFSLSLSLLEKKKEKVQCHPHGRLHSCSWLLLLCWRLRMPSTSTSMGLKRSVSSRNCPRRPWSQVRQWRPSPSGSVVLTLRVGMYKAEQFSAVQNQWIVNPEVRIQITVEVKRSKERCKSKSLAYMDVFGWL